MNFLIIAIIIGFIVIIIKSILNINYKEIKNIIKNRKLDDIVKKYPDNIEICKWYLKKLNNESVTIEENSNKDNCLYIAILNKILIANIKNSYSRIQTIAHECLHSIQDKKILYFNFIYTNIYLLYYVSISILAIFKILPNQEIFLEILIFFSMVHLLIRTYLENDAMIKARYLAKEYMEEQKISSQEEINDIIYQYDMMNEYGIKCTNFQLFLNCCVKIIIFSVICFIR